MLQQAASSEERITNPERLTEQLLVDGDGLARGPLPAELRGVRPPRLREPGALGLVVERQLQRHRQLVDVVGVEHQRGVAGRLWQRPGAGDEHRAATGHPVERDQPEPLVQRRHDERVGAAQERVELRV